MDNEVLRYKTLYEIEAEENEVLKKQFREVEIAYENKIKELKQQQQEPEKHNIIYRGLRKIYRKVVKR